MRCPTLSDLPPPPAGKTGWPWTEGSPAAPALVPGTDKAWPLLSIVTPSYNQGRFLEETIRSVLLQGHPNLEYIVKDGGSTDESKAIIRKYEPWIADWVSRPDGGQANAVNMGFEQASGALLGYVNADDVYAPGAYAAVAEHFVLHPDCELLIGGAGMLTEDGDRLVDSKRLRSLGAADLVYLWRFLPQLSCFWTADVFRRLGGMRENLHYGLDTEYFLRFWFSGIRPDLMSDRILAFERKHSGQKTQQIEATYVEVAEVIGEYFRGHMGGALWNVLKLYAYWRRRYVRLYGWRGIFHKPNSIPERYGWRCLRRGRKAK